MGARASFASAVLACWVSLAALPVAVRADVPSSYAVTAAAVGASTSYVVPDYTLVQEIYNVGMPEAALAVDSTRGTTSWASVAYPGDTVVAAPGTVNGNKPAGAPSAPDYPLIVKASASHPDDARHTEAFDLAAHAGDTAGRAVASVRESSATTVSISSAVATTVGLISAGTATGRATSDDDGVQVGPLTIARVASAAAVAYGPNGISRTSSFHADGIAIGGTSVGLDDRGLVVAGTRIPVGHTPVGAQLAQQGIAVQYLAPRRTPSGVISAGLVITVVRQLPGTPQPGTLTIVLGQAEATAVVDGQGIAAAPIDRGSASPAPGVLSTGSAGSTAGLASSATTSGPASVGGTAIQVVPPQFAAAPTSQAGSFGGRAFDVFWIYAMVALSALCALAATQVVRRVGVRTPWATS